MDLKNFRFETLPRTTQLLIFVVMALVLSGAVYYLYIAGLMEQKVQITAEVTALEASVEKGTAIAVSLPRFREVVTALDKQLEEERKVLPSQKETPIILERVQEMAASSNLRIIKFTPQPQVPRAFYLDWPIRIEVEGSYDALGEFFSKISRSTRIINVDTIAVKGIEGDAASKATLSAVCTATTFVFREDQVAATGN